MKYIINYIKSASLFISGLFLSFTAFSQSLPDTEIKRNITTLNEPLQKLVQLEPKVFEYETGKFMHLQLQFGKQYGFLAENVQEVFPELVKEKTVSYMFGKNSYRDATIKTVDASGLIPLLVAAVKEQQQQIDNLKAELAKLQRPIK